MHMNCISVGALLSLIAVVGGAQAQARPQAQVPAQEPSISQRGASLWEAAVSTYMAHDFKSACQLLNDMSVKDLRALEQTVDRKPSEMAGKIGRAGKFVCQVPKLSAEKPGNVYRGEAEVN